MTGREFASYIMPRYGFRRDAAELILRRCTFELWDEMSTRGGGFVEFGDPCRVVFKTSQHEAAVHELAHAWWAEVQEVNPLWKEWAVHELYRRFEYLADHPDPAYPTISEHARVYKYGDGANFPGMWIEQHQRWNHDEIFAGFASSVMGNMQQIPPDLLPVFSELFRNDYVYIPAVMA